MTVSTKPDMDNSEEVSQNNRPIAIFDSGVGGVSVLRQIYKLLPRENYIFFSDTANAPYGERTKDEVFCLTSRCMAYFMERGAKAVVLACNTATSAAAKELREKYANIPIIGLEPALKPAVLWDYEKDDTPPRVLVMATELTLREEKFQNLVRLCEGMAEVLPLPAPGLVRLVEAGKAGKAEMKTYLEDLLAPYREKGVDSVVLGCTHFPFAKKDIKEVLGDVLFFDGAEGAARQLKRRLMAENLLAFADEQNAGHIRGTVSFENSSGCKEQLELCKKLFTGDY